MIIPERNPKGSPDDQLLEAELGKGDGLMGKQCTQARPVGKAVFLSVIPSLQKETLERSSIYYQVFVK